MPAVKALVKLIQCTPDMELTVATAAKLCYSDLSIENISNKLSDEDIKKFINKLMSLGHMSPIEHVSFTFGIEGVSRAFLAQITRHRIASFSVKSQRYVGVSADFNYIVPPAIQQLGLSAVEKYTQQMTTLGAWYKEWQALLGLGEGGNEDARFVLPNSAETKMIVTMNARELLHFFNLRCCNRAQWEIRDVAWLMLKLAMEKAPNIFCNAGPSCIGGVCSEGKMSCKKMEEMKSKQNMLKFKGEN